MNDPKFFISYARQDSKFVLEISKNLKEAGANIWIDQLDIIPGQRWGEAITIALDQCQGMIIFLSPAVTNSNNVLDEINFALEEKRRIIPVIAVHCTIPYRLRRLQHIDFTIDESHAFKQLLASVARDHHENGNLHVVESNELPEAVQITADSDKKSSDGPKNIIRPNLDIQENDVKLGTEIESKLTINSAPLLINTLDSSTEETTLNPPQASAKMTDNTKEENNISVVDQSKMNGLDIDPDFNISYSDSENIFEARLDSFLDPNEHRINPSTAKLNDFRNSTSNRKDKLRRVTIYKILLLFVSLPSAIYFMAMITSLGGPDKFVELKNYTNETIKVTPILSIKNENEPDIFKAMTHYDSKISFLPSMFSNSIEIPSNGKKIIYFALDEINQEYPYAIFLVEDAQGYMHYSDSPLVTDILSLSSPSRSMISGKSSAATPFLFFVLRGASIILTITLLVLIINQIRFDKKSIGKSNR